MRRCPRRQGFSLTEVLLAVAILAVGMLFVGGTFVLGIHFSTLSTEQTIGAVAAQEAATRIRLYGLDPNQTISSDAQTPYTRDGKGRDIDVNYPSVQAMDTQYAWSALCRWVDPNADSRLLQLTVFVSRGGAKGARPAPTMQEVAGTSGGDLQLQTELARQLYEGSVLVDDATGWVYRVTRFDDPKGGQVNVTLDRPWQGTSTKVWAVLRPSFGGRNPCVAVYQTEVRMRERPQTGQVH